MCALTFQLIAMPRSHSYSAPLYVDMKKAVYRAPSDEDPVEADWEHQPDEDEEQKIFIGKVSIVPTSLLRTCRAY